jgi:L-ascorbate metabolism protein UlaG (beta-lactamase superfamily)
LVGNKVEAIKSLFFLKLKNNDLAFLFLGYSGILLRSEDLTIAIDPGKSLTHTEVSEIKHLDFLLFTHNHWDHYKKDYASEILKQTQPHTVADIITYEELKANVPPNMLTKADPRSKSATYHFDETEITALQGIHVGPITQYLINLRGIKV